MTTPHNVPGWDDWQGDDPECACPLAAAAAFVLLIVVAIATIATLRVLV